MKNWYIVSFRYSENVHCTNLCLADNKEQVEEHYKEKYDWASVRPAEDWEIDSFKRRGMPIVTLGEGDNHE